VEFGTPWELIQKDGMFRELCRQSGEDAQLMEVSLSRLKIKLIGADHRWRNLLMSGKVKSEEVCITKTIKYRHYA